MQKLIARKNRFPWVRPVSPTRKLTVRMDTTNLCNLRCSMCPMRLSDGNPERKWHHMAPDVFEKIKKEVFPLARTVGISCGAEPLTNPGFPHQLRDLYRSGVPYREMVTNGTLLNEEWIGTILRYPPTTLSVSIDGATDKTHSSIRDGANLSKTIEMLKKLVSQRGKRLFPMLCFSTTLQRDNLEEMVEIVALAAETGAVASGFVPLVPYHGLNTLDRVVSTSSSSVKTLIRSAERKAAELGIGFSVSEDAARGESAHPCPYLSNTVYIDPDGSIFPCPYWNTESPLGNIMDGFRNIWHGTEYRRLREGKFHESDNCCVCPEVTMRTVEVSKNRS